MIGSRRRRDRRRIELAMHELRRPLQALLLQDTATKLPTRAKLTALDLALAAMNDLERTLAEAGRLSPPPTWIRKGSAMSWAGILIDAADRWQQAAWLRGGAIRVICDRRDQTVVDRKTAVDLARALDNLILNSLLHGGGNVLIRAHRSAGSIKLTVSDSGDTPTPEKRPERIPHGRSRRSPRRHGHGLKAVGQIVAGLGGSFDLRREGDGMTAVLDLPAGGTG